VEEKENKEQLIGPEKVEVLGKALIRAEIRGRPSVSALLILSEIFRERNPVLVHSFIGLYYG
jgi:hypothetical protein